MEKYMFSHGDCSDLTYDICSLLHIGPYAYSKNGEPVFSPLTWRGPWGTDIQHDMNVLACIYALHYVAEYHFTGCFPPSSVVQMENGRSKTIGELMIGDTVMVMDEEGRVSFSDVNLMMHKLDRTPVEYIILEIEDGLTLTMSKEHVVFVSSVWSFSAETRMASKVEIGDYLFRPELTNGSFVPVKVTAIRKQVITGAYAPTTLAGNIVVDGHLASSSGIRIWHMASFFLGGSGTTCTIPYLENHSKNPPQAFIGH
ncbi:desert hedgehog protein B-like [Haliotis rubra]|uniref:desert hedgehog protein B-like n=1 Tax=Haliotis rubra TaxID=36100 RepID=UPI001EE50A15|nr:desert hedgehog protein B-like [Haliotis rubra]